MRYLVGLVLVLALGIMGCSETSGMGGSAGDGGAGGVGGVGGAAGNGGNGGNGGQGSLFPCTEEGILDAIAEGGGPHTFDCDGVTTVARPTPFVIDNDVILEANGNLVVERGPWWEVRSSSVQDALPVFQVSPGATTQMIGFVISGGGTPGPGISNDGLLTLRDSQVFGSESVGLLNYGTMVVEGSTVSEIENYGIRNLGMLTAVRSSVDASNIDIENAGTLELEACTVSGSIYPYGDIYSAGSIQNSGTLTARGSTMTGRISGEGTISLVNSTIYGGNPAISRRGANPWVKGSVSLTSTTVSRSGGDGPAILIGVGTTFETTQSIIVGGCAVTPWDQRDVTWTSSGYNLESPGNTCQLEDESDLVNIDPYDLKLEAPSDNGGSTETMALGRGSSAAVDAVPAASCAVNEDQRGVPRPHGDACDIGAFEWAGPSGEACVPSQTECEGSEVDPIEEMCEVFVPDQVSACDGTESVENPATCTASGTAVVYKLTRMQVEPDCNTGYDLDNCYGSTCLSGGLAQGDGENGVDNSLGSFGRVLPGIGANLGMVDQILHEAICTGATDIQIAVDAAPGEGCAATTVSVGGTPGDPIPMHLSEDGCLSGTLGTLPIGLGDAQGRIENAVVHMTVSPMGFSDGTLGGIAPGSTAVALGEAMAQGAGTVFRQAFDINADLLGDSLADCDSMSLTLEIGGTAIP